MTFRVNKYFCHWSRLIGEYHGDTFTAFSRSDSFVWLIDTLGKINDIDAGWKATPDGSPALLVKTPLNLVQHRIDVVHIFLWDTAFNMIVGTRAQRIGDLSGAAFMTRTRTYKYGTVIFVMMSKGLTIDWMEFYISFTWFLIEERK